MRVKNFITAAFFLYFFSLPLFAEDAPLDEPQVENEKCALEEDMYDRILQQVELKNPNALTVLPYCFRLDHKLILKAAFIDASQFKNAAAILQEDEIFVTRLLKINSAILQFASPKLLADPNFMERATYISRDSLKYADPKLLNNKLFIKRMIKIDSRNYMFASDRLKEIPEFAKAAFLDNGLLLAFAPAKIQANKELVTIAVKSNASSLGYAAPELRANKKLIALAAQKTSIKSKEDLEDFLHENYLEKKKKKNLGFVIGNKEQFFKKNILIDHNYITKWQRVFKYDDGGLNQDFRLITADSHNYPIRWKQDFKKYPDLIKKIESFFQNHNLDQNTIFNLSTTYLWKIKDKPLTLAFNLYLLRDNSDSDLGRGFSNITSLTAIAQKQKNKWTLTVLEVIFDSETKVDVAYPDGLKRYVLWDLYAVDKKDKNPKIIFKTEDKFNEYFEIYEEQNGGKYNMIYRIDPLTEQISNRIKARKEKEEEELLLQ
jgi:hypothetical protein